MADLRASFTILEDVTTQAGLPLHKAVEGDAAAGLNAHPSFIAKDPSNNLIYLKTNAAGELIVDTEAVSGTCKKANGELATGSATLDFVTGCEITLTANKVISEVGFLVSCQRDALFQVIWLNNATPTLLGEIVVGAGAYTFSQELHCLSFTAGSTLPQKLQLKAKNFNALASLRGSLTCIEGA